MATGPGFYDNLTPQSWQDGSAATWTLQDPHQQSKFAQTRLISMLTSNSQFQQPSTARATKPSLLGERSVSVGRDDALYEHRRFTPNTKKARESLLMKIVCAVQCFVKFRETTILESMVPGFLKDTMFGARLP